MYMYNDLVLILRRKITVENIRYYLSVFTLATRDPYVAQ